MGAVQLSVELQHAIEREVQAGRASSVAEFVEEAAWRLVEEADLDGEELVEAALAGIADSDAGRYTTIASEEDARRFHGAMMARVLKRLEDGT